MVSRLCVKGLGPAIVEKDLTDLFSQKGEVTDVRVMRAKSGRSRQFAFVGFRTEDQAKEVMEYFNNTFLKSSRIVVEVAEKATNKGSPTKESKGKKRQREADETKQEVAPKKIDKDKEEFMEMMKSRNQSKLWGNDATDKVTEENIDVKARDYDDSADSDEDYIDTKDFESEEKELDGMGAVKETNNKKDGKNNLDSFIKALEARAEEGMPGRADSRKGRKASKGGGASVEEANDEKAQSEEEERGDGTKIDNTRLFVKNLPFTSTEDEITTLFGDHGKVRSVHLPLDPDTKTGRGFGFVEYDDEQDAKVARDQLDGASFQGRVLRIEHAEAAQPQSNGTTGHGSSGASNGVVEWASTQDRWLQNKHKQRSSTDGVSNAAFTSADAVVDSVAASNSVSSRDILDVSKKGGDLAVRLAITETKVIGDNRDYFVQHGVHMEALESALAKTKHASARSTTTILIKNLPHSSNYDDLERMFTSYGAIASFLVPPSKTVALVDYIEPSEARNAFKGLAYRRYQHTPLYLEWAPLGVIGAQGSRKRESKVDKKSTLQDELEGKEEGEEQGTNTLYVSNVDFASSKEDVIAHLDTCKAGNQEGLRSVVIPPPKDGKGPSSGYCFLEYASAAHARRALEAVHRSKMGVRALEAQLSTKRGGANTGGASAKKKKKGTSAKEADEAKISKLAVRNVAFQATEGELHALFAAFGSVKRVKLPKKMDGTHRGFGFVEFSSHLEAKQAMHSLAATHLYGRHLILEWAKADE